MTRHDLVLVLEALEYDDDSVDWFQTNTSITNDTIHTVIQSV